MNSNGAIILGKDTKPAHGTQVKPSVFLQVAHQVLSRERPDLLDSAGVFVITVPELLDLNYALLVAIQNEIEGKEMGNEAAQLLGTMLTLSGEALLEASIAIGAHTQYGGGNIILAAAATHPQDEPGALEPEDVGVGEVRTG